MRNEKTVDELLEDTRKQSGAAKLAGHDIMDLERFAPDTRHMIVFDVLTHDSPVGWKGEKARAFLTEQDISKSLATQKWWLDTSTTTTKTVSFKNPNKKVDVCLFSLSMLFDY